MFQKFVRLDIRGVKQGLQAKELKVSFDVKEGEENTTTESVITFPTDLAAFIADSKSIEDTTGTEVTSVSGFNFVSSTKYKHFDANIVAMSVEILDTDGKTIYLASWPEELQEQVTLPDRLKPRVFTAKDGRKVEAVVGQVNAENVVLVIKGSEFTLPLDSLSEPVQEYLRGRGSSTPAAPGGSAGQ